MRKLRWGIVSALLVAGGLATVAGHRSPAEANSYPPPVKHVFVIVLENKNLGESFAADSKAPYLAKTLRSQGVFLSNYYGIGHESLDNYIAMVSGQPPNPITQSDCQTFVDFVVIPSATPAIPKGAGCVYPASVKTITNQLDGAGKTWRGYMEDMGDDPVRDNGTTCAHPNIGPLSQDHTQSAAANDQYATRHNPFMYFHSVIDKPSCRTNVVNLRELSTDLQTVGTTRNFNFITPDLCHDGHDATCVDGGKGGLEGADAFLEEWVPKIQASPAYQQDGMIVVTWDEAEGVGLEADARACCGEKPGPNTPLPGVIGPGGGLTGAIVLSPMARPGGWVAPAPYNHYSLLRTIEDIFHLPYLGMAAAPDLKPFGNDVFQP